MNPGRMDQRVTFQEETLSADGGGGGAPSWADIGTVPTVWASVVPMRASETLDAAQLEGRAIYRLTVRNRSDITAGMRILWVTNGNLVLNIRALPDPGPRALYRTVEAEAGAPT
jgi:SPP1 family predicted phage head-tail adaptor